MALEHRARIAAAPCRGAAMPVSDGARASSEPRVRSSSSKRVRKALQAQGHEVFTPTLTGLADRSHLLSRAVNLETHILDVVNLICWEELTDIVLCGHSYGGCVVSGVADRLPERVRALVYLDAFVLEDGQNQMQHLSEAYARQFREGAENLGEGWKVPPVSAAAFNVNAADREWVDRQCTMQPIETMLQRLHFTGGIETIKDVTFIRAAGYTDGSPFPPFYEKANARGWTTRTVPCGHDVMLDLPEELTALLVEACSSSSTAPVLTASPARRLPLANASSL